MNSLFHGTFSVYIVFGHGETSTCFKHKCIQISDIKYKLFRNLIPGFLWNNGFPYTF